MEKKFIIPTRLFDLFSAHMDEAGFETVSTADLQTILIAALRAQADYVQLQREEEEAPAVMEESVESDASRLEEDDISEEGESEEEEVSEDDLSELDEEEGPDEPEEVLGELLSFSREEEKRDEEDHLPTIQSEVLAEKYPMDNNRVWTIVAGGVNGRDPYTGICYPTLQSESQARRLYQRDGKWLCMWSGEYFSENEMAVFGKRYLCTLQRAHKLKDVLSGTRYFYLSNTLDHLAEQESRGGKPGSSVPAVESKKSSTKPEVGHVMTYSDDDLRKQISTALESGHEKDPIGSLVRATEKLKKVLPDKTHDRLMRLAREQIARHLDGMTKTWLSDEENGLETLVVEGYEIILKLNHEFGQSMVWSKLSDVVENQIHEYEAGLPARFPSGNKKVWGEINRLKSLKDKVSGFGGWALQQMLDCLFKHKQSLDSGVRYNDDGTVRQSKKFGLTQ